MKFIICNIISNRVGFVRLGEHTIGNKIDCVVDEITNKSICANPPVDINVEKILMHQGYAKVETGLQLVNDIALLRLENPVNFTSKYYHSINICEFGTHLVLFLIAND